MRCCACNKVLADSELTLKLHSGEFADMCGSCYSIAFASEDDFSDIGVSNVNDIEDVINMLNVFEEHRYE